MKARLAAVFLASACLPFLITGCSGAEDKGEAVAIGSPTSADAILTDIDGAFSQMNYGEAAKLAASGQQAFPGDARLHLAAARAQARLGDAEESAVALERARSAGLTDLQEALTDSAFATVRSHRAFARFATPSRATSTRHNTTIEPESRIRAGDVEIIEEVDGDYIRAGDVVLDTRH